MKLRPEGWHPNEKRHPATFAKQTRVKILLTSPPTVVEPGLDRSITEWRTNQIHIGESMKFLCLGYLEEEKWDSIPEGEREALITECFAYDDVLKKNGHFVRGEALQPAQNGATLHFKSGKVVVTDGPYTETREHVGGLLVLEAKNLKQAIELMSKHPGVRLGPFEIRPLDEEFTARANRDVRSEKAAS
jgi:hypothetical protein